MNQLKAWLVLGAAAFLLYYVVHDGVPLMTSGETATATVVSDVERHVELDGYESFTATLRYVTADGKVVEGAMSVDGDLQRGDHLEIAYDPAHPDRLYSGDSGWVTFGIVFLSVIIVMQLAFIIYLRGDRGRERYVDEVLNS